MATGNLTIVPNAVVREISVDKNTGLVNGAHFVDRQSKREIHAKARAVVIGASCLESTRILLNSRSPTPAVRSGTTCTTSSTSAIAWSRSFPSSRRQGAARACRQRGYIPRFRNLKTKEKNFIRGYAFDFSTGGTPDARYFPSWGEELQKDLERSRRGLLRHVDG